MTPSARLEAILSILGTIGEVRVPMDTVIGDYMRNRRYIGSKDRAFIANRLYEIVRHKARLEWHAKECGASHPTPRHIAMAAYYFFDERTQSNIEKLFDGSKYGPEALTEAERIFLGKLQGRVIEPKDMPLLIRTECPLEHAEALQSLFGGEFEDEMKATLTPAPLDLRVNVFLSPVEEAQKLLKKDNVETKAGRYSPWALRAQDKVHLSRTKAFQKGWVDIQDEGSQLIALACQVEEGQQVLDYCAGAGGKTLALANAMNRKGRIVAMDLDPRRLDKSKQRFKRAHVSDMIEVRPLSEPRHKKWVRRQKESFDRVLVDVPCSGSGTWRRNPDMRWINYGPTLSELLEVQAEILDKVAHTVKVGGRLIYATCSLFEAENEAQITKFLEKNSDFELVSLKNNWPQGHENPCADDMMHLTPNKHDTDGFFTAVLTRTKSQFDDADLSRLTSE
tara:strand:+ start:21244 stop:22593 length:1350 start_codon:yes stop_codon:yes gene_type:complete